MYILHLSVVYEKMIKKPLIAPPGARPLSFLITIGFEALRIWKIFNNTHGMLVQTM